MLVKSAFAALGLAVLAISPVNAQTIYPLDRAEILVGSKFDLKVEFEGTPDPRNLTVTINGEDAGKLFNRPPQLTADEDGSGFLAYWIKGVSLSQPGKIVVEAKAGNQTSSVTWEAFDTPKGRVAKNVILFIGDGMSVAHRTAARIMSKGIKEGRYGGELAIDDMPYMAMVSTAGTDSIVTDSANSMSSYTTGHKSCVNAMGIYCARNKGSLDHPKVETIAEIAKRKLGIAIGVITNTEIEDATPAAVVSHTRRRADYDDIVKFFYDSKPEVMMGGGWPNFLPETATDGKRKDGVDYIAKFQQAGYAYATTATDMRALAAKPETTRFLGLYNPLNVDGALDRKFLKQGLVGKFPDQPDLTDQVRAALQILSRNDKGFFLMVESGRIDKYSHSLDWERAVYDTIMLDNAVKVAKEFAGDRNDTMIVVTPDHAHPISLIGTYDDAGGENIRDKLALYDKAKFPSYPAANAEGYPESVWVSRRLAVVFAAFPDHCDAGKPYVGGENQPAVEAPQTPEQAADPKAKKVMIANEENCKIPGAARRTGNLPFSADRGIHSGDDVILTAMGPGAEAFHGRIDNTRVFRAMAVALGLAAK